LPSSDRVIPARWVKMSFRPKGEIPESTPNQVDWLAKTRLGSL
jgi:hypothetical protein